MSIELLTSEIYGPRGLRTRSMDVDGYRHNYEGSYEKFIYQISINRERTTII